MTTESKVRVYKTIVRPVLTYVIEKRSETAKTKSISTTTEMMVLRSIKGVTLTEQIRSKTIRRELPIQNKRQGKTAILKRLCKQNGKEQIG